MEILLDHRSKCDKLKRIPGLPIFVVFFPNRANLLGVPFVLAYQNSHAESEACQEVGSEIPGLVKFHQILQRCQWISLLLPITIIPLFIRTQIPVHGDHINAEREAQSSK